MSDLQAIMYETVSDTVVQQFDQFREKIFAASF